jgi:hypothetical protein
VVNQQGQKKQQSSSHPLAELENNLSDVVRVFGTQQLPYLDLSSALGRYRRRNRGRCSLCSNRLHCTRLGLTFQPSRPNRLLTSRRTQGTWCQGSGSSRINRLKICWLMSASGTRRHWGAALGCEQTRHRETLDRAQGSSLRPSVVRSAGLPWLPARHAL